MWSTCDFWSHSPRGAKQIPLPEASVQMRGRQHEAQVFRCPFCRRPPLRGKRIRISFHRSSAASCSPTLLLLQHMVALKHACSSLRPHIRSLSSLRRTCCLPLAAGESPTLALGAAFHLHSTWRSLAVSASAGPSISDKTSVQRQASLTTKAAPVSMAQTALDEMKDGAFVRTASACRSQITADGSSGFPAVANRYHLYISYACPWASRCFMVLKLKGLEDAIGMTVSLPVWAQTRPGEKHMGWPFAFDATGPAGDPEFGCGPDPVNGAHFVRDLYEKGAPGATKYSVPVLWDKETGTIVNNESADIIRMFNREFNAIAKNPHVDICPPALEAAITAVNEWVYPGINNGVYRCGFATKQAPYEQAFKELFEALDRAEAILSKQRYLTGDTFTEADIRLFATLIRFDEVYVVHFKCNKRFIREYPNLFNYTKDIYQIPGIAETVNMKHIKHHYFRSHPSINPFAIVPVGLPIDYASSHDRERFSAVPLKFGK